MLVKGIFNFPNVFVPKLAKGASEPKFNIGILLPATDPQVAVIQQEVNTAIANGYPSGMPAGTDCCFGLYETKIPPTKEYHDPRFVGWYLLTCSAKADDRPSVVDENLTPIIDPSTIRGGHVGHVDLGITYYSKGKTGIGGWLNGVMFAGEEGSMGMLDNKRTAEQMFGNVATPNAVPGAPATAGAPVSPPPPPASTAPVHQMTAAAPVHQMTAAANGASYDQMIAAGWTDETLISNGMMLPPGGIAPVFS